MIIVLSPAKALNMAPAPAGVPLSQPLFREETAVLAEAAKRLTVLKLRRLMRISEPLAVLARERFQAFDPEGEDGLQAAFAFNGDVYAGLKARELDVPALKWAQDRLRILSGLYGVLRPLDAIQPYRLEMGSSLKIKRAANLYGFWGVKIAQALNAAAEGHVDPSVINLASQEYFAAVDRHALTAPVVTCHFREEREGVIRTLSFLAKKARGQMARFIIEGRIERAEEIKTFDVDGYSWRPELSTQSDWVFAR
jgi:cytoplasmic iron level regulating protein YaaA (DUF328/UPF0246 family)